MNYLTVIKKPQRCVIGIYKLRIQQIRENWNPLVGNNPFPEHSSWKGYVSCLDGDEGLYGDHVYWQEMVLNENPQPLRKDHKLLLTNKVKQNKKLNVPIYFCFLSF